MAVELRRFIRFIKGEEKRIGEMKQFSPEASKALIGAGYWICPIRPVSLAKLLLEENTRFAYVNFSEFLRTIVPEAAEAAVDPRQLAIPESNWETLDQQQKMIKAFSSQLQKEIPGVVAIMRHAATYVQLDLEYQKIKGEQLFVGLYARTPDKTVGSLVAGVGRMSAGEGLDVFGWDRGYGDGLVWAVPVVVPK